MGAWSSHPAPESKSQIFLTGATGYIGGQTLHAIASTIPSSQVAIACLVRSAEKGKLVQNAYPEHVRTVLGDLDDVGIIEKECQKAQVVLQLADTKHMRAARAIVKGLSAQLKDSHPCYIQMSGASMFVIPEIEGDHYGEPPSTMWNDLNGISSILSTIQAHPSREMDNYILSLDSTIIRTGLVVGPLIYGHGEGPGNQRSIQAPTIARKTIQDGEGFRFRRGLNTWSNVHIRDLGDLFALLTKTALDGPRNTRTSALWNETGVYLPANGDMTFGKLCEAVARAAHVQGLIKKDAIDRTIDVDEANAAMPGGAVFWGTNAVYKSSRAQVLLGWTPSAPSLGESIAQMVRLEGEDRKGGS